MREMVNSHLAFKDSLRRCKTICLVGYAQFDMIEKGSWKVFR